MWHWILLFVLFLAILFGAAVLILVPAPERAVAPTVGTSTAQAALPDLISVVEPLPQARATSPLEVKGEARGNWFFEASAPVELLNTSGAVIAQAPAQAQGNWMTSDYVPFSTTLTFPPQPAGSAGTLVLKNDNPSGDPANQKELDIPVRF